jgi:ParB-like chromosome segregation protein Spo0J
MENKLTAPLSTLKWVDRNKLKANNWNPNKVTRENLDLLIRSILANGWTEPIVCRPDYTIIDGFHRWLVSGEKPLYDKLDGKVPIVFVKHEDEAGDIYGTVTHNRARGTHLLEPMKNIIKRLMSQGKSIKEISKELGMKPEEIFRLSDLSKEHFLKMMASRSDGYSKELYMRKV